ncbi:MAG: FecR domain-containing protein [Ferruginibacter sp.]|nr:FecR domain-containing protein [Cytophagales bacterium]
MPPDQPERIIRAYLSGKDSPEGRAYFEHWARKLYQDEKFIASLSEQQLQRLEEKLLAGINRRIDQAEAPQTSLPKPLRPSWRWAAVAASLTLLLVAGGRLYRAERFFPVRYAEIAATAAGITRVKLPDGSRVQLPRGSRLRYPEHFLGRPQREVILSGEAYFQVAKNPEKAFVVTTRQAKVKVLGTRFNVKEITRDSSVVVAVEEGRVAFGAVEGGEPENALLTANTVGVLTRGGQVSRVNEEVSNYLSWMNGRIAFRNASLPVVARQLERVYGVAVILADPALSQYTVTLNMGRNQLPDVLNLLTASLNLSYTIQGNAVTLRKP